MVTLATSSTKVSAVTIAYASQLDFGNIDYLRLDLSGHSQEIGATTPLRPMCDLSPALARLLRCKHAPDSIANGTLLSSSLIVLLRANLIWASRL
jgi:hypothetical protein